MQAWFRTSRLSLPWKLRLPGLFPHLKKLIRLRYPEAGFRKVDSRDWFQDSWFKFLDSGFRITSEWNKVPEGRNWIIFEMVWEPWIILDYSGTRRLCLIFWDGLGGNIIEEMMHDGSRGAALSLLKRWDSWNSMKLRNAVASHTIVNFEQFPAVGCYNNSVNLWDS